ncbi:AraC family transcriptional regulator [Brevundimonas sp.]
MYDPASLACQNALGGVVLETSRAVGWRSLLVERRRWTAGEIELSGTPSPDLRLAVALGPTHYAEVFSAGKWRGSKVRRGTIGVTAPGDTDRLRWSAQTALEATSLYISQAILAAASDQLRISGAHGANIASAKPIFADAAVTGVVSSLISGMRRGAPEIYAESCVCWLAMHLMLMHGRIDPLTHFAGQEGITDKRLLRAVDLIRMRYAENLTLDELASVACVSKFHFSRLFRKRTG